MSGSGGDGNAAATARAANTMRDRTCRASVGGWEIGFLGKGPTVFVTWRPGLWSRAFSLPVHDFCETRQGDAPRSGSFESASRGGGRCPGREDIIHEQNVPSGKDPRAPWIDDDRALQNPMPLAATQAAETRRSFASQQAIHDHLPRAQFFQFLRQQRRLVEPALPQSPPVQRHRHDETIRIRYKHARHHPGQQGCKGDALSVLESEDEFAGHVSVMSGGGD